MFEGWVANTDFEWFERLGRRDDLVEVNFWRPSAQPLRPVPVGAPFFFKLKSPHNAIGGFGVFAGYKAMPLWLAWECFREANGAPDLAAMRLQIDRLRARDRRDPLGVRPIGCLMVTQPVFFPRELWVPQPADWKRNVVTGATYDLTAGEGLRIWKECAARQRLLQPEAAPTAEAAGAERYGMPLLVRPRLGQGAFRACVTDAYERACAVTGEHSLPALEAAHIRPYTEGGVHEVSNGILLRADLHRLLDAGYVTVTPDHRFEVSRRLKEEFENGRSYYPLRGREIHLPGVAGDRPDPKLLAWHNANRFLG